MPWVSTPQPKGTIEMWSGTIATIPGGWAICDGNNGTPDLLDIFVRGVASGVTDPGAVGGLATVTLTNSQIAGHSHAASNRVHEHRMNASTADGTGGIRFTETGDQDDQQNTTSNVPPSQNLIATGSNGPHDNIPPFFTTAYIMKL